MKTFLISKKFEEKCVIKRNRPSKNFKIKIWLKLKYDFHSLFTHGRFWYQKAKGEFRRLLRQKGFWALIFFWFRKTDKIRFFRKVKCLKIDGNEFKLKMNSVIYEYRNLRGLSTKIKTRSEDKAKRVLRVKHVNDI